MTDIYMTTAMKKKITEQNAVATVLNSLIKEINANWGEVWSKLNTICAGRIPEGLNPEFAKFQFILAASAVNLRVAFELFGRRKGERMFNYHMNVMKQFLGDDDRFRAVQKSTLAYMDAYNRGIMNINSPASTVAIELVLNFQIRPGADSPSFGMMFDPAAADYLSKALVIFSGKWEKMEQMFDIKEG